MTRTLLFASLTVLIVLSHMAQNPELDMFGFFQKQASERILIAGLGNPGRQYEGNRHNIGFMAAGAIASEYMLGPFRNKFQADMLEGRIGDHKIVLLKPQTYMNESGRSVVETARFFKIPPERIFIIHDELDLPPGKIRVRQGGGTAGHNGLKSIQAQLGSPDFWRIRVGIGHPGDKSKVSGYVLSDFAKSEAAWVDDMTGAIADHIALLLDGGDGADFTRKVLEDVGPVQGVSEHNKQQEAF